MVYKRIEAMNETRQPQAQDFLGCQQNERKQTKKENESLGQENYANVYDILQTIFQTNLNLV